MFLTWQGTAGVHRGLLPGASADEGGPAQGHLPGLLPADAGQDEHC